MIMAQIESTGVTARKLAQESVRVVARFKTLCPEIDSQSILTESTLSRLRSANARPKRDRLIVLGLTCDWVTDPASSHWTEKRCQDALAGAYAFAHEVLAASSGAPKRSDIPGDNPVIARHRHTKFAFGSAGEQLLAELDLNDGSAEAKLELLHRLAGDSDDARYWRMRAEARSPDYAPPESLPECCTAARRYALEYFRKQNLSLAQLFLQVAADRGDEESKKALASLKGFEEQLAASIRLVAGRTGTGTPSRSGPPRATSACRQ